MLFLSTKDKPGMFNYKEISNRIHDILEKTNGQVPDAEEFWQDELRRKHPYTLKWINSEYEENRRKFIKRLFYGSVFEAQTLRLLSNHTYDYIVAKASNKDDMDNKIDFTLVPMFSGAIDVNCQVKAFVITNSNKEYVKEEKKLQKKAFGLTAEYLTLGIDFRTYKTKEEACSNPTHFVYSPENGEPVFYKLEEADRMIEHMQQEVRRKCRE